MIAKPNRFVRTGTAYIVGLLMLAVFVAMAASLAATADMNARMGKNLSDTQRALWAAESGMSYAVKVLRSVTVPSSTTNKTAIANIAAAVSEKLDGTANLGGQYVSHNANNVHIPAIDLGAESCQITVVRTKEGKLVLLSKGMTNNVARTVAMDLSLTDSWEKSAFTYGVASYGPIVVDGTGEIHGMNELNEASVVSASSLPVAIVVAGTAVVDGDLSSVGADASVVITGTPTIAGSQDPEVIAQHVHFGVEPPVFPEIDTSLFKSLTTSVIDQNTNTGAPDLVFNNPLIKAGTNPTFSSNVVLNGVVYIEAPNIVTFDAKVTLNGLIATDDTNQPIDSCRLTFAGQLETYGVDVLSTEDPLFTEVKKLGGTFMVAPGFDVRFAGQFSTVNGTIAADKLTFTGQAEGTIEGTVLGLRDTSMYMGGTVNIVIDRGGAENPPPGFVLPLSLAVNPSSYRELTGSAL